MLRLFLLFYTLAFTVLAGSAIVAALTIGRVDAFSIILAAGVGAVLAVPVAFVVARQMT